MLIASNFLLFCLFVSIRFFVLLRVYVVYVVSGFCYFLLLCMSVDSTAFQHSDLLYFFSTFSFLCSLRILLNFFLVLFRVNSCLLYLTSVSSSVCTSVLTAVHVGFEHSILTPRRGVDVCKPKRASANRFRPTGGIINIHVSNID